MLKTKSAGKKFKLTYNIILIAISIVLYVGFGLARTNFFSLDYLVGILKMAVEIGILALPTTALVIMGVLDFSMCTNLVLSSILSSLVATATNPFLGVIVGLGSGLLFGCFNGFLVAVMKLPYLVTTLACQYLYRGLAQGITLGTSIGTNVPAHSVALFLGGSTILGVPTQFFVYIILALIYHFLLSKTPFGRTLYAIGLNEDGAKFAGINTVRNKFLMYATGGIVFAIAGQVLMGRFSTMQYNSGDAYLMQVLIATILGGADMGGGRGDIRGTTLGVLVIGILKGGMNVLLLPQTTQKIVLGLLLLIVLISFEIANQHNRKVAMKQKRAAMA